MIRGFEVVKDYQDKDIRIPQRKTEHSAGYDIEAAADMEIRAKDCVLIPTGLKAYMLDDEYLGIFIRSSFAGLGLRLANGQGIVDADYYDNPKTEGHISFLVYNCMDFPITVRKGERIGQGVFYKYLKTDDDSPGGKRIGGWGSTGV